jgi:hypothetical protein
MWVFLSDAFLSIVANRDHSVSLLVRARLPHDITNVFPDAKILIDSGADYRFRTILPRETVAKALSESTLRINYTNFKDSVPDRERHDAYLDVWSVMADLQDCRH